MRQGRVRYDAHDRIDRYEPRHRPLASEQQGLCGCGVETTRFVTLGPPGHPENGPECHACGELRLRLHMHKGIDAVKELEWLADVLTITSPEDRFGWLDDGKHEANISVTFKPEAMKSQEPA